MEISDKEWTIPMEVNEQAIIDLGLNRKDVVKVRIGCRTVDAILVPCTEEQYKSYMRAMWNEEQKEYRSRKCMIVSENTGKLIRCTKPCKDCNQMKSGNNLSINAFEDDGENITKKMTKKYTNECEAALTLILLEQLIGVLQEQNPLLATIFRKLYNEDNQREIARCMALPHSTMTDYVRKIRAILQEYVTAEDIVG